MRYIYLLATAFMLVWVRVCYAVPVDFLPKFSWFGGDLEFKGSYANHGKETNGKIKATTYKRYRETLNIETEGYVYHPKLFYFSGQIAMDLEQEARKSASENGSSEWKGRKVADEEYDLYGIVLGRSPLSLNFHISQDVPFLSAKYDDSGQTTSNFFSSISANYKKKALVSSLSYSHSNIETVVYGNSYADSDKLFGNVSNTISGGLSYENSGYSVSTSVNHYESMTKGKTNNSARSAKETNDKIALFSRIKYKNYLFDSEGSISHDVASDKESFRCLLREDVSISLPWQMSSNVNLYYDRDEANSYDGLGAFARYKFNETNRVHGTLNHKLFDSVLTTINADYKKSNTTTSQRGSQDYRLSVKYSKKLRGGGMGATINNGLMRTKQQGTPEIDGERQDEVIQFVGDSFRVDRTGAQAASLVVEVFNINCTDIALGCIDVGVDPITGLSGAWQNVSADQWSIVNPGAQFLEITFNGSPVDPSNSALYQQDFGPHLQVGPYTNLIRVSYFQPEADFIVQSNTAEISANITLFDGLFSAYSSHSLTGQQYVEGDHVFGELATTVTEDQFGMTLTKAPFNAATSYRLIGSEFWDEKRWSLNGGYHQEMRLFNTIPLHWGAQYRREELLVEDSVGTPLKSEESTFSAQFGMSTKIPFTPVTMSQRSHYLRHRGGVVQHGINSDGIWELLDLTRDDDKDLYNNRIDFGMTIPYVKMRANFFATYNIEENFTDNTINRQLITQDLGFGTTIPYVKMKVNFRANNKIEENFITNRQIITRDLEFNTGRSKSWKFGSTFIILAGAYDFSRSIVANTNVLNDVVLSNRRTEEGEFEISLTVRRTLF